MSPKWKNGVNLPPHWQGLKVDFYQSHRLTFSFYFSVQKGVSKASTFRRTEKSKHCKIQRLAVPLTRLTMVSKSAPLPGGGY